MAVRVLRMVLLVIVAWTVMTFTHEAGHIVGGWASGGTLQSADLRPWHMPYSIFAPNPRPLVTLWSGLLMGVLVPVGMAAIGRRRWTWFVASFCLLANGAYIAAGWVSGDRYLDAPKLLEHGANPLLLGIYCLLTIGWGYVGFRQAAIDCWVGNTNRQTLRPHHDTES